MSSDIDRILEDTLADGRLSRSEGKALRAKAAGLTADRRAYWRSRAFTLAKARPDLEVIEWLEDVVKALVAPAESPESSACFSPGEACRNTLIALFNNARESADACVFTITDDAISQAIYGAHQRGVRVRIISDNDKAWDKGSDIDRLRDRGVPVRIDISEHHMHHKFAIFDAQKLANGSYNWTRSAFKYNEENLMVVEDPKLLRAYQAEFDTLWARFA